jgi:Flp pilus assembly protein TadG
MRREEDQERQEDGQEVRRLAKDEEARLGKLVLAHLRRSEGGQALVEFALVLPMVVVLLLGILDFGQAINYKNDLTALANQAARYAEANACQPCGNGQTIESYVQSKADGSLAKGSDNITEAKIEFCFPSGSKGQVGEQLRATAKAKYTWLPLVGGVIGKVAETTLSASETVRVQVAYNESSTNAYSATNCPP